MKRNIVITVKVILAWWLIFGIAAVVIFVLFQLNPKFLLVAIPGTLGLTIVLYVIYMLIFWLGSVGRYARLLKEYVRTKEYSPQTLQKLYTAANMEKNKVWRNIIIKTLTGYYLILDEPKAARDMMARYTLDYNPKTVHSITDQRERMEYAKLYLLLYSREDDLADAERIYNQYYHELHKFIDDGDEGVLIRCIIAEYFNNRMDAQTALLLLAPIQDNIDRGLKRCVCVVKGISYMLLNNPQEEASYKSQALQLCETEKERNSVERDYAHAKKKYQEHQTQTEGETI
ncbi:MAG: hypothetical protein QM689_06945 [Oscillospiraceae bacterium]